MTNIELSLLAAICADPGNDTPRLVYADWLEENAGTIPCENCARRSNDRCIALAHGTDMYFPRPCEMCHGSGAVPDSWAAQAEFIRVQLELSGWQKLADNCQTKRQSKDGHEIQELYQRREYLAGRERELVCPGKRFRLHGEWFPGFGPAWVFKLGCYPRPNEVRQPVAFVSRGFVSRVTCSAEDWLAHAHQIAWRPDWTRECENCDEFGEFTQENSDGPSGPCPECGGKWNSGPHDDTDSYWDKGTGRVTYPCPPTAQPVEVVMLTTIPNRDMFELQWNPPKWDEDGYWSSCRWTGVKFTQFPIPLIRVAE